MRTTWAGCLWALVLGAACLAAGCDTAQLRNDARSRGQIQEDHATTRQKLAASQAELGRLQAGLLQEGWTRNEKGDLVPPRGMDAGGQTAETENHLHALEAQVSDLQDSLTYNERVWRYRGYDVAELTRDAAIQVSPPVHHD